MNDLVAVLLSYPEYQELMHLRALVTHRELVQTLGEEAERQGLSEEQLLEELEQEKRKVVQTCNLHRC